MPRIVRRFYKGDVQVVKVGEGATFTILGEECSATESTHNVELVLDDEGFILDAHLNKLDLSRNYRGVEKR